MTNTLHSNEHLALEDKYGAHNYSPLPVIAASAEGSWVVDVEGHKYLDCLAGYSAMNFGHLNPELIAAAQKQLNTLTLTSRALHHDQLGLFCKELADFVGKEAILPMNTGAEAVETALKIARRWGYRVKGITENQGNIIVAEGNFHGRTISVISFSNDDVARADYGPYTPGFVHVPYGDAAALADAIDENTIGMLVEPIQGEGGVVVPPAGYLQEVRKICTDHGILMMADEIQSGLGRTGKTFACDHEDVTPDMYIMGKALGGGVMPLSAVAANHNIMDVITPGSHGSTFGGNPLAVAVGRAVIKLLSTGDIQRRAAQAEAKLKAGFEALKGKGVLNVRTRGMWAGVDIDPSIATGKAVCKAALEHKLIIKETHESTLRFSPPLTTTDEELDFMLQAFAEALSDLQK